ncbi:kinase-like domain-containing protein [Hyaloraphidium curvatum]|nr:kinase-like domain-containing protein [Hyaloraphidium curvatum]
MASDASMRLVARRALFTGLALALVLLLLLDQTAATEANGRRRPGNASNRKNIKRPGNNNNNNANNNGQNNGQNNAPSAPARRPDRFLVALKPFETDFLDRAQVRMLRRDLLTMSAWKTEELTKSQAVIYRAKPLKVMGAARGRQPAIIIKDAVFDNDPEVAAKQFGMLKYEIEVMDDVNGLPFMVRYLGSQITGPTANKGPDVKIFLNLAHEGSLESVMEKRYKGALDLDSVNSRMIVGEMIVALAMLHSKGYLHRDIKMEQFLVGADGHIRLTDFGLAIKNDPKVIWDDILSNLGSVAFTPQNAPELKGKVYNYKERLLIPGKMHLQLDNPSYRAPELQEARRISTLQNDAVISIFERLLAEKRAEKKVAYDAAVAANAEKLPSKKLTPNEIATIRNRVKGEFAQEMPGW